MEFLDDIKESHYDRNDNEKQQNAEKEVQELINECRESGSDLSQVLENAGWDKRPKEENIYHQNINGEQGWEALFNTKYTKTNKDENSSCEVVICSIPLSPSYLVTDPLNMGTFNKVNPDGSIMGSGGHLVTDILSYSLWGNNRNDTSDILDRTLGSKNAAKVKVFIPRDIGDYALIGLGGVAGYSFMVAQNAWAQSAVSMGITNNILNSIYRPFPKPSKHFVPDGVFLVCSDGWRKSQLKVTSQTSVKIAGGKLMGTVNDRMDSNMNCAKMVVAGAIIGAIVAAIAVAVIAAAGVFTGGVGAVMLIGAAAGATGAIAGGIGGMLTGFIPCICAYLTQGAPWIPVHTFMKVEKQMPLIEKSKLSCFLGGSIQIFYNENTASEMADLNFKGMLFDWGSTVFAGAMFGASATCLGGAWYGGRVALSLGGKSALYSYVANCLGFYTGSKIIDGVKDWGKNYIYDLTGLSYYKSSDGIGGEDDILDDAANGHDEKLFSLDAGQSITNDFKEKSSGAITDDIGGVYAGANSGAWVSDSFPNGGLMGGLKGGLLNNLKPFIGKMDLIGVSSDVYDMIKNYFLSEDIKDVVDTEDEERQARRRIHVTENNI